MIKGRSKTLVIAEAGVNHNGNLALALKLVDAAADAGADIVKFQSFKAESLVTKEAEKAPYQQKGKSSGQDQFSMLKSLELSDDDHYKLLEHCRKRDIVFLSTAFDSSSFSLLCKLQMPMWKIPSGEITNLLYIKSVASQKKEVILSTGMATISEIDLSLKALLESGIKRSQITLLHCTSEYPAPFSEINLLAIQTLRSTFGVSVGYSDHTEGISVAPIAVALGASVIEKHLTLDCKMDGPDHKASIEPDDFFKMVSNIRIAEECLGDGIKAPTPSELINLPMVRKSLVASRDINIGEELTLDNIVPKRPGTGISPMRVNDVLGRKASKAYSKDEIIEL